MMVEYRFTMGISPIVDGKYTMELPDDSIVCLPIWGDDLSKEYEAESGYQYRARIEGNLRFVGPDFDTIDGMDIDDVMVVQISKTNDGGVTWSDYHRGYFTKTDCEFDYDNRTVSTAISTIDDYTDMLSGINKKYDLIRLAPAVSKVDFAKRGLLQFYAAGEESITCIQGDSSWEVPATATSDEDMLRDYHFAKRSKGVRVVSIFYDGNLSYIAQGTYIGTVINEGTDTNPSYVGILEKIGGGDFTVHYKATRGEAGGGYWQTFTAVYSGEDKIAEADSAILYNAEPTSFNLIIADGVYLTPNVRVYNFYSRILTDAEVVDGEPTERISSTDIMEAPNFKMAVPYYGEEVDIVVSTRISDVPTKWGVDAHNRYILPPSEDDIYQPIARSNWQYGSFWVRLYDDWADFERLLWKKYTLHHAYTIDAVISVLLAQIAPGVSFKPTPEYSEFLYGTTKIKAEPWKLLIAPKTNILHGKYQMPSQSAMVSMQNVLSMLQNLYQLYWFIENGKLRIEHVSWFKKGRTYDSGIESVVVDIVAATNPRVGKSWAFGQNKMTYTKNEMPERYEFAWMDDASVAFKGHPIEILSPAAQKGNIEQVIVERFSSDVDYIMMNPSAISQEGFVIMGAEQSNMISEPVSITSASSRISISPVEYEREARLEVSVKNRHRLRAVIYKDDGKVWESTYFDPASQVVFIQIPAYADAIGFESQAAIQPNLIVNGIFYGNYSLPITAVEGSDFLLQNAYASFIYAVRYWMYDLPSKKIRIEGYPHSPTSTRKTLKQTVRFPSLEDLDPLALVRTDMGDGQIQTLSVQLSTREIETILMYEG